VPTGPSGTLSTIGRQSREALEQAARKLFAERGFHGTTLSDITSAVFYARAERALDVRKTRVNRQTTVHSARH
jgi:AcrR family transcriptional regulator